MPISWNEIRQNAIRFASEWAGETREDAEAQPFWEAFFKVFGIERRTVADFEKPVRNIHGQYGYIDLFWPGVLLVEHKSFGKDLKQADSQASSYIFDLIRERRLDEVPRYVIVTDFARFEMQDFEPDIRPTGSSIRTIEFPLEDLHKHIHDFAFIPGYKIHTFEDQDPINRDAVRIMGHLHDTLKFGGYAGHALERMLVRVLFCLFAEDSGIFNRDAFRLYIENHTKEDGSDLGPHLARLWEVLNTPQDKRQDKLDEDLAEFPYVNGALFDERLGFADFNRDMRNALLASTRFDWSSISPAIFGSLFQSVMQPKERRESGGHYTSERNILKVIRPLFLDELRAQFERVKRNKPELKRFHERLGRLRFLDPACGCGNFLVITYRELRALEIEVLTALHGKEQQTLDITQFSRVDVDQFYGIEISEWPARIAEVAMWLMDHQMNLRLSEAFGQYFVRLPLKKSPHIHCGNALRLDWKEILPPDQCSYVLGNPPFIGAKFQSPDQRADMELVADATVNCGLLDYVSGWYFKAAEFIQNTHIVVGFVSTNSLTQGEQVGVLWNALFQRYGIKIHFGHRTFPWESEARGKAHVHVVIIGFASFDIANKQIYDCEAAGEKVTVASAKNISPYLIDGPDRAIVNRDTPLCDVPEIGIGNKPIDDGNYLFTPEEKAEFLKVEPRAIMFFHRWLGSVEFINGIERWCLWLGDCPPDKLREMPEIWKRVEAVSEFRLNSKSLPTKKLAEKPTRFHVENMPDSPFLVLPEVSSERRKYIPIGFVNPEILCSNLVKIFPNATLFHFGVLTSAMHMAWVRQVGGRLKSDYRYSSKLVYNNYPWPVSPTDKQRAAVVAAAQAVLDVREKHLNKGCTLADLYDPIATPSKLVTAHAALDRAVDHCYRKEPFNSERQRVEFLFALYEQLTAPLLPAAGKKKRKERAPQGKSTPESDDAAAHFYSLMETPPPYRVSEPGGKG